MSLSPRGRAHRSRSALLALALLAGCSEPSPPGAAPAPAPAPAGAAAPAVVAAPPAAPEFERKALVRGMTTPHAMQWGGDQHLWITERSLGRISRLDPASGLLKPVFTMPDLHYTGGQDGLVGFALHPRFGLGEGKDHVYVSLSIKAGPDSPQRSGQTVIRRYTYDAAYNTLAVPRDLMTNLPHSIDHQSGRLVFGPDGMLYFSIGDQGANQLENMCRPNRAQDLPSAEQVAAGDWSMMEGKILRLDPEGGIPADNPEINGVRSPVYAYGFRNAQGLAFAADGTLYQSEQGPKTDDEINRIVPGGNYAWPRVAGYKDDKAYVFADWSHPEGADCASLVYSDYEIPDAVPKATERSFAEGSIEPLRTFHTVDNGHDFKDPACAKGEKWYLCWPTIAPSSIAVYQAEGIPAWKGSLLVPSLKEGKVYRLPLDADSRPTGEPDLLFESTNRYRDVLVSPDGRTIYVLTDGAGTTRDAEGGATDLLEKPGAVLAFTVKP